MVEDLRLGNRTAYLRKSLSAPDFCSDSILTRDVFSYVALWLKRQKTAPKVAQSYWRQAEEYYRASLSLSAVSSPLTIYYCYLNATKALLSLKAPGFSEYHGMTGKIISSKIELVNEETKLKRAGIIVSLSNYLSETEPRDTHNLKDLLANLPFIHRAFCLTYKTQTNLFLPIQDAKYVIDPATKHVTLRAKIGGRFTDGRYMATLPAILEQVPGEAPGVVRSTKHVQWHKRGASKAVQAAALTALHALHHELRAHLVCISAPTDLWYVRREVAASPRIERYGLTIMLAAMHRLSELSRYDPAGLEAHLSGKRNWLLSEFLQLSPAQFIDEIACEMTGEELRMPGVRTM